MEKAIPQNDHDLLVSMVATTSLNQAQVIEKINDLKSDIASIKDGVSVQIENHNLRIRAIEKIHDELNPEKISKLVYEHENFISDYKSTHKERNIIISGVIAVLGFMISILTLWLEVYLKFGK